MSKLLLRLFFAKEFRKMAKARQRLGQLPSPACGKNLFGGE
jgi:hypothetical protein